jgi:RNA polymerase sigma-70 factor (ECF subfamily)
MPDDTDRALIARVIGGGTDGKLAFKELYDRHQRQVYTTCYRLLGDAHRAADATQEAFLAVLRGLPGFGFQSSFRTWLFQVAKNAALQQRRKASSRMHLSLDEPSGGQDGEGGRRGDAHEAVDTDSPAQIETVIASEFGDDLQRALNRLKPQHSEILSLRYFGGLSYEALAEILECSIGTVKSRISRAHRALRPLLLELMKRHDLPTPEGAEDPAG